MVTQLPRIARSGSVVALWEPTARHSSLYAGWCEHRVDAQNGKALLWCPKGARKVCVRVYDDSEVLTTEVDVDVAADGVYKLDLSNGLSYVQFKGGCFEDKSGVTWFVYSDEGGSAESCRFSFYSRSDSAAVRALQPGTYVAVPRISGTAAQHRFNVTGSGENVVELPALGARPQPGTVTLSFPWGETAGWELNLCCLVSSGYERHDSSRAFGDEAEIRVYAVAASKGAVVSSIPLGVPVVYCGSLVSPDGKQRKRLQPFVWTASVTGSSRVVEWSGTCPDSDEWDAMFEGYSVRRGLYLGSRDLGSLAGYALPWFHGEGEFELALYDVEGHEFVRRKFVLTKDGKGPVPLDLRQLLLDRGEIWPETR